MIKYLQNLSVKKRAEIAQKAGIGSDYLYQIMTGYRKASPTLSQELEAATDGELTKTELRPDIYPKELKVS